MYSYEFEANVTREKLDDFLLKAKERNVSFKNTLIEENSGVIDISLIDLSKKHLSYEEYFLYTSTLRHNMGGTKNVKIKYKIVT